MTPSRIAGFLGPLLALILVMGALAPTERALLDAARDGDVETVRGLIAAGVDVDAAAGDGMTALHWAAERRDVGLAEILLEAGAEVDVKVRIGAYTPLHMAAGSGSGAMVRLLLAAGADPMATTSNSGTTPLHLAAAGGNPTAVKALLEHGAEVNARERAWDQTPLVFAAANNRVEAINVLLAGGADPSLSTRAIDVPDRAARDRAANTRLNKILAEYKEEAGGGDQWQPTPAQVQEAIQASRELIHADLEEGVEEEVAEESDVEESDVEESDVEEMAQEMGMDQVAQYPDLVGSWGGLTPLLHAVRQGHVEATLALLEGGADVNQQADAGDRTSPLLMAAINGHFDLASLLIERGANPNLASDAGATPLHAVLERQWAPRSSYAHPIDHEQQQITYLEMLEVLLEAGADPNARLTRHLWYMQYTFDVLRINLTGATPFWRAAYATDLNAMRLLVAYGADPTIATQTVPVRRRRYGGGGQEDLSGIPAVPVGGEAVHAIHAASGVGYGEGFAANAHRHVPGGWLPAVRYLVEELGANVNARDHNAYTPLHHAASRGDVEMIRYLVEQGADVTPVSRQGQTTADMANGPYERIQPFPGALRLLESLGAHNNQNCVSC